MCCGECYDLRFSDFFFFNGGNQTRISIRRWLPAKSKSATNEGTRRQHSMIVLVLNDSKYMQWCRYGIIIVQESLCYLLPPSQNKWLDVLILGQREYIVKGLENSDAAWWMTVWRLVISLSVWSSSLVLYLHSLSYSSYKFKALKEVVQINQELLFQLPCVICLAHWSKYEMLHAESCVYEEMQLSCWSNFPY